MDFDNEVDLGGIDLVSDSGHIQIHLDVELGYWVGLVNDKWT